MSQSAGNWFLIALVAGALAGCAGDKKADDVNPNIFPADYKQEIIDTLTRTLIDPTNIREAYVTEPSLVPLGKDTRYIVCVRSNSRDFNRNYSGSKDRIGYFFGGHLNQLVDATPEQCGKAVYKPFPELEKVCLSEHKCN
jgi:ABC-type Fe3+-hydroxamate transport system substrate-binding protein